MGEISTLRRRMIEDMTVHRRSTGRAEGVDLFVPAVARYPPGVRFARNCHIGSLGDAGGSAPRKSPPAYLEASHLLTGPTVVLASSFSACSGRSIDAHATVSRSAAN